MLGRGGAPHAAGWGSCPTYRRVEPPVSLSLPPFRPSEQAMASGGGRVRKTRTQKVTKKNDRGKEHRPNRPTGLSGQCPQPQILNPISHLRSPRCLFAATWVSLCLRLAALLPARHSPQPLRAAQLAVAVRCDRAVPLTASGPLCCTARCAPGGSRQVPLHVCAGSQPDKLNRGEGFGDGGWLWRADKRRSSRWPQVRVWSV
jgi:hypothetical protein